LLLLAVPTVCSSIITVINCLLLYCYCLLNKGDHSPYSNTIVLIFPGETVSVVVKHLVLPFLGLCGLRHFQTKVAAKPEEGTAKTCRTKLVNQVMTVTIRIPLHYHFRVGHTIPFKTSQVYYLFITYISTIIVLKFYSSHNPSWCSKAH